MCKYSRGALLQGKEHQYEYIYLVVCVNTAEELLLVERYGAVVKHRTRDREVPGSIPTNSKCCFLEQETLSTLLSTGFYPGKKRATWKISTKLLNVLPSINKVDNYYYYYYSTATSSTSRSVSTLLCLYTVEELFYLRVFYKTKSTSTSIPTLHCVLI